MRTKRKSITVSLICWDMRAREVFCPLIKNRQWGNELSAGIDTNVTSFCDVWFGDRTHERRLQTYLMMLCNVYSSTCKSYETCPLRNGKKCLKN
eukprot:TRINITY_DN14017_c0_g1_i1.p1 TRINITY_DN14017_c0_g1~~TRINITY_DN14017_c0_g1_i1.p1  ORF type:complete len:94 (-),score=7.12 TRINITY_DN14017_c0_g1_i1:49-330(-)